MSSFVRLKAHLAQGGSLSEEFPQDRPRLRQVGASAGLATANGLRAAALQCLAIQPWLLLPPR